MPEETNQTSTQEESLFDEYGSEDTNKELSFTDGADEDGENSAEGEENENPENGGEVAEPEKHEIVYNGQRISLTLDELKTNAQKGMNYDHVHDELVKLRNSPALGVLERYAKKNGMSTEKYVEYLREVEERQRINCMTEDGVPENVAKRLVELEDKEKEREEREAAERRRANDNAQFNRFIVEYPDVKATDIPEEVWQRFRDGMDLTASYAIYENKALKNQVKQLKQNEINKQKSVGSVKGDSSEANADAFLEGLFG